MNTLKITEGFMPYKGYETYYRITGDIAQSYEKGLTPLVLCHGGPGSSHNYFEVLDPLAENGRAIIMYDQLGCGKSFIEGHDELWHKETWTKELIALRAHLGLKRIHLLGQSWGGMLAITYLCDYAPEGIASAILSSTLSSSKLWGQEQWRQIGFMEKADQEAIKAALENEDYHDPAYLAAVDHFMQRHCNGAFPEDAPECLRRPKVYGRRSYLVAWGPNEFTPTGNLSDWDYTAKLSGITQPVLVISGTDDLSTPLVAKTMADAIKGSTWELFPGCKHMCFVDACEKYMDLLKAWMADHE